MKGMIQKGVVDGWDDPRLATLSGLRRRGFPPNALVDYCARVGVSQVDGCVEDVSQLEHCVRAALNASACRIFAVLRPLRLRLSDPSDPSNWTNSYLEAPAHPQDATRGTRLLCLTKEVFIDRADFRESGAAGFKRLVLGGYTRLRYGPVVRADRVVVDAAGVVQCVECSVVPHSVGARPNVKTQGVLHWVSADPGEHVRVRARLFSRLFLSDPAGCLLMTFANIIFSFCNNYFFSWCV
jgi:glutaminyl-tRNA synthetase